MDRVESKELETFCKLSQISSRFFKITQLVISETNCELKSGVLILYSLSSLPCHCSPFKQGKWRRNARFQLN